ncbi:MAG TPA: RNA polymerase factor sigma-54 [Blastocatellia bacterium]|nr:RNA polymerase factor sigma-54 [Blastocatellia bacterium]
MSVKPHLQTSLSQRLVLTPQMRQRIEMLQMTKLELSDMILAELDQNVMLEEPDPGNSAEEAEESSDEAQSAGDPQSVETTGMAADAGMVAAETPADGEPEPDLGSDVEVRDPFEEIDFGRTFEEYLDPGYKTQEYEEREEVSYENFLTRPPSLQDQLLWQLGLSDIEGEIRTIAEAIIGNLDEDGYLGASLEEIAEMGPWPLELVEQAHVGVTHLDPIGIGARNARECLLIQLENMGAQDRLAYRLVRDHWDHLPQHKLPEVARQVGLPIEIVVAELEIIRSLDPYPGRKFVPDDPQYIEPEVSIEKVGEDYVIRFNDDGLPQLRINKTYRQIMLAKDTSKETRDYIKEKFRSAIDLLKNIEHRRQTILRVCQSIVERQHEFLDRGVEYLRPMMLKDVAEDIGMHLSTVSRVVNRKYVHTPQGVIELRRFFTEGMKSDDGEDVSTRVLKLKIKKMIEGEDPKNPITDDEVAKRLAADGVKLSRRTVAKYRDQMRIPGSRERRAII